MRWILFGIAVFAAYVIIGDLNNGIPGAASNWNNMTRMEHGLNPDPHTWNYGPRAAEREKAGLFDPDAAAEQNRIDEAMKKAREAREANQD